MSVRQLALELVQRAAVRAARLAQFIHRDRDARVRTPQADRRGWAEQRQSFCTDFDETRCEILVGHVSPGVGSLYVSKPIGILGVFAGDYFKECSLQLGRDRSATA